MKKILYMFLILMTGIICFIFINYNYDERNNLRQLINYKIESKEVYTPKSYDEYALELENANEIIKKIFINKEEINLVINNLQDKLDNLVIKPDKSLLIDKYNEANDIDLELYIPNSTSNLEMSLSDALIVINDENSLINDVNDSIKSLEDGINSLILKPDKTSLIALVDRVNNIDKSKYTSDSIYELNSSVIIGNNVIKDVNATVNDVDNAIELINSRINNLVVISKGIYKITYSAYMLSNNHVGNEWGYTLFYNDKRIKSGELITCALGDKINVSAEIYEYDSIMDYGYSNVTLIMEDGYSVSDEVYVYENRGRYYGNVAIWKINYYVSLVKSV